MKSADETAVAILGWLAGEPELLSRFLALTGTDAASLRKAVGDPGFMGGLVAFLMEHEPTLMAFCTATETAPEEVVRAHQAFSGPANFEDI
ncbi:DUF3572 domain-containing protein [Sinorhizobium fredii]|uniref:DUF3572 domain-containing protein n=1 Tax=Rhizobium fredii TaxID=380 RepID=UPI0005955F1D|nr:DUF3572 domain-containing protein [Sinorhizobium fredii]WOS63987.1 DUF3572 domain-containing protein [Sinorhizobium fredii GR64]